MSIIIINKEHIAYNLLREEDLVSLPHAILGLLHDRPMTGYDLKLLFDKELNSFWPAQMSQVYRELGNLEAKELVDSRIEAQETRPDRKVYSLTAAGKQAFHEWINRFPPSLLSPCRDEFALRVFLANRTTRDEMQFQFRRFIREKQSEIATYTLLEKNYETMAKKNTDQAMYRRMTMRRSNIVAEALVLWAEDCLEELDKKA